MEGARVEEVLTWRVRVWRKSTHRPSKNAVQIKNHHSPPPKHTQDQRFHGHFDAHMIGFSLKNKTPDHRFHGHVKANMTGSSVKIPHPRRPKDTP